MPLNDIEYKLYFWTGKGRCHRTAKFIDGDSGEVVNIIPWQYYAKAVCGTKSYSGGLTNDPPSIRDMCYKCFPFNSKENEWAEEILKGLENG